MHVHIGLHRWEWGKQRIIPSGSVKQNSALPFPPAHLFFPSHHGTRVDERREKYVGVSALCLRWLPRHGVLSPKACWLWTSSPPTSRHRGVRWRVSLRLVCSAPRHAPDELALLAPFSASLVMTSQAEEARQRMHLHSSRMCALIHATVPIPPGGAGA